MFPFLNGLGIAAATGRGIASLRSALEFGWRPPAMLTLPDGHTLPVYPLPPNTLEEPSLGRKMRRANRYSRMSVLAASDALQDAMLPSGFDRRRIGVIVASALGSHATTFQFLDEILTYGDDNVSPTVFSHSVQNAAAAYVASVLDLQGPVCTFTQVHFAFHCALLLGRQWLTNGSCDYVLVGGTDELGSVMNCICRSLFRIPKDGKIRPFGFSEFPVAIPGEGSAFFVISAKRRDSTYAQITHIAVATPPYIGTHPDLHILEADGTIKNESSYKVLAKSGGQLAAYAPIFGSMTCGTPLQTAAAALMLKEQMCFATPIPEIAADICPLCLATTSRSLSSVYLTRLRCNGMAARIQLASSL